MTGNICYIVHGVGKYRCFLSENDLTDNVKIVRESMDFFLLFSDTLSVKDQVQQTYGAHLFSSLSFAVSYVGVCNAFGQEECT